MNFVTIACWTKFYDQAFPHYSPSILTSSVPGIPADLCWRIGDRWWMMNMKRAGHLGVKKPCFSKTSKKLLNCFFWMFHIPQQEFLKGYLVNNSKTFIPRRKLRKQNRRWSNCFYMFYFCVRKRILYFQFTDVFLAFWDLENVLLSGRTDGRMDGRMDGRTVIKSVL